MFFFHTIKANLGTWPIATQPTDVCHHKGGTFTCHFTCWCLYKHDVTNLTLELKWGRWLEAKEHLCERFSGNMNVF